MITLHQLRNTSLVEVRVYHSDNALSAIIANNIVLTFGRQYPDYKVELIDAAQPPIHPIRPNVPLNMMGGGFLSLVIAAVFAGILRLFIRLRMGPRAAT